MKRQNGQLWLDDGSRPIHAHGGWILRHGDYYYWYGEDRREDWYVSCYRSRDLKEWEFRSHVLTCDSPMRKARMRTGLVLRREDGGKVNLERPKVLYNEKTGKFVLWAHYENGLDYTEAAAAVATGDAPDEPFTYHGHFNPYGCMSRDCTLFRDDDGTAYFISASRDNADMHVYRLSEDYLNVSALVHRLWPGEYREAPALAKIGGRYCMLTSFCTGWAPNQCKYAWADSIEGRWSDLIPIGDETTYFSQPAFLLQRDGKTLYFGDRWGGKGEKYFESGYVAYPLEESEGGLRMVCTECVEF